MTRARSFIPVVFACLFLLLIIMASAANAANESVAQSVVSDNGLLGSESRNCLVVAFAKSCLGFPYIWGGKGIRGFDCSGFVYYVFNHFGYELPRTADGQYKIGINIQRDELQPGDLVFFSTYEPGPSHVGIYIGDDAFIHASSAAGEVTITSMKKEYYMERFIGARRLISN